MTQGPNLLNDDGTASIATALMSSHHAFRRDLIRFERALETISRGDTARADAVREEWKNFHAALHGHHTVEDTAVFPDIASKNESMRGTIEKLSADHRRIDPVLERGDRTFAEFPKTDDAKAVVRELKELLDPHLALEEAEVVPFLRDAKIFPAPETDEMAAMYADGFSWSLHGLAPEVVKALDVMLPENVKTKLPAARVAFEERCVRVWGNAKVGASRTPIPEGVG
jgi:hemerythrin-like domain-containing protein